MSAAAKALETPTALRLMHGISTGPATGSQMSPRRFLRAMAAAWITCSGVPPPSCASPAAVMAEATPISDWATADRPGNGGTHGHEHAHRRRDEQPVDDGVVAEPPFLSRRKKSAGQHPAGPRRGSRHHTAHGTVILHDRQRTCHRHADGPARKRLPGFDAPGQTESRVSRNPDPPACRFSRQARPSSTPSS